MSDEFVGGGEQVASGGSGVEGVGGGGVGVPSTPAAAPTPPAAPLGETSPTPEQLYEVKVNGQPIKVGLKELLNGYSRQSDYTRHKQALAREREEWTSRLSNYEKAFQETRALLGDRQRLAQILQQLPGDEGVSDELLTRAQVEEMRTKWFEDFKSQLAQEQHAARYQQEVESLKQNFLGELKGVYEEMGKQYPLLKKLPLFNELRLKVGAYQPQSIEDAKALLANEIRELAKDNGWEVGGAPERPAIPGIEPPGGTGMMPAASSPFKTVRDPGLKQSVLDDIQQIMRASLNS